MAKPEWGSKRICLSCGARFYDFQKDPITCPGCGTVFDPAAQSKPRRPRAPVKIAPVHAAEGEVATEAIEEAEVEVDESEGDEEEAVAKDSDEEEAEDDSDSAIEDVSELGDDDMADVIDTEIEDEETQR